MSSSPGEQTHNVDIESMTEQPALVDNLVLDLPPSENKKFYPALDGFRAVAVLMVFCQHYVGFHPALVWGWSGVSFFFVLSGFLITGILYDTKDAVHRYRNFYVRRTLRIFPLFYGVLLLALLLTPVLHWVWHPAWLLWPLYLGNYGRYIWLSDFLHATTGGTTGGTTAIEGLYTVLGAHGPALGIQHFWSLCVEEQFYLVWPFVVFLVKKRLQLRNICITVCVLALAARIACVYLVPAPYLHAELLYRITPLRADDLLLGGLLALMLRGPEALWLKRFAHVALYAFIAGFAVFEVAVLLRLHHFYYPVLSGPGLSTIGFTLIGLFAAIIILLSLEPTGPFYRIFTIKPLRLLGQMSYGFYVFHDIPHLAYMSFVSMSVGENWHFPYVVAALAFVCTLIMSYLSFRFIESPFLRLKDRFTV